MAQHAVDPVLSRGESPQTQQQYRHENYLLDGAQDGEAHANDDDDDDADNSDNSNKKTNNNNNKNNTITITIAITYIIEEDLLDGAQGGEVGGGGVEVDRGGRHARLRVVPQLHNI